MNKIKKLKISLFSLLMLLSLIFICLNYKIIDNIKFKIISDENIQMKITNIKNNEYVIYVYDNNLNKDIQLNVNRLEYWNIYELKSILINKKTKKNGFNEIRYEYNIVHKQNYTQKSELIKKEKIDVIVKDRYSEDDSYIVMAGDTMINIPGNNYYIIFIDNETNIASIKEVSSGIYDSIVKDGTIKVIRETYKNDKNEIFYKYN